MAEGKWIPGLKATTALAVAARRTLRRRLEVVGRFLGPALHEPHKDPENVHQLRVGTRRAVAALELFASTLPHATYRRARRRLRGLRRAAGVARDWDVFLLTLSKRHPPPAGSSFVLGFALGQRAAAQNILTAAAAFPFGFDQFAQEIVALIDEPAPNHPPVLLVHLGRTVLSDLLHQFHQAMSRSGEGYEPLHCVRIVGKRLRYTMEVFGNCFAPAFRNRLYPAVEAVQEILGRVNDSRVAVGHLTGLRNLLRWSRPEAWKKNRPAIEGLLEFHQRRLAREMRRHRQWQKQWEDSGIGQSFAGLIHAPLRAEP